MSKQDILNFFSDINYAYNDSTRLDTLRRMLDELVEQAAQRWHRVEERLPNVGELVVGLDADGHAEITMLSEAKCWLTYGLWIHNLGCYVWWMPLPEPPQEE